MVGNAIRIIVIVTYLLMLVGFSLMGMPSPTQASDPRPPSIVLIEESYQKRLP
jgi:hypothetical protein